MQTRVILIVLVLVGAGVLVVPGVLGWEYYTMSVEKRIRMPRDKRPLRSSGAVGHMYGYLGTFIMMLNFLYLIRKRYGNRGARFGNMKQWMHFHVFVGLVGPILIFYHTAFVLSNVFARISLYALLIVVFTGIFGRFIYATIPRDTNGNEQTQAELSEELKSLSASLDHTERHAEIDHVLNNWLPPLQLQRHGAVMLFGSLLVEQLRLFWRRVQGTKLLVEALGMPRADAKQVVTLWLKYRRYSFLVEVLERHRKTLSSWRALHRTLTYVMVLTAIVHVFIATVGFGLL